MPSPLKEYRCLAHGPFDSRAKAPKCPYGCSSVHWSPRTAPAIRTNQVMRQMDALQDNMSAEFGGHNLRSKHEGESSMGLRPPSERPGVTDMQEYLRLAAMNQAPLMQSGKVAGNGSPVLGMWGTPTEIPNAPVTPAEKRSEITPTDLTKFAGKPVQAGDKEIIMPKPEAKYLKHKEAAKEPDMLQTIVQAGQGL